MADFPALPLWTDAYIADTVHLDATESGAYLHLLMSAWRLPDCSLPDDDRLLARWAKCTPGQWKRIRPVVMAFWTLGENQEWTQKRLMKERNWVKEKSNKAAQAANAKWLKNKGTDNADAPPKHMPDGCPGDAPIPIPIKKEEGPPQGCPPKKSPDEGDDLTLLPLTLDRCGEAEAMRLWNVMAERHGLPLAQKLTDTRKGKLRARLADCGGLEGWQRALEKVETIPGLLGANPRKWRADIDFLLQEKSFTKLMEGSYDRWDQGGKMGQDLDAAFDNMDAMVMGDQA